MAFADWARSEGLTPAGRAVLGARRIYILPTRYGLVFAVLLFLMLLGAVNYGNNPAHLLTFLLATLGANAIYLTWANLRGLQIDFLGAAPVFAGQDAAFALCILPDGHERPAIQMSFDDSEPLLEDVPENAAGGVSVTLKLLGLPRGEHLPGRLTVSTCYPLGLFRAWCYVNCDLPVLVYPRPGETWTPPGDDGSAGDDGGSTTGSEDFAGLRNYVAGDTPSQIDWKSYARDRGLNTRLFSGQAAAPRWIDWHDAPGGDNEARVSALTRAVLDAERVGRPYGLRTPDGVVDPGQGAGHRHQCLRLLALQGWGDA